MFSWPPFELEGQALLLSLQVVQTTSVLRLPLATVFKWLLCRGESWDKAALQAILNLPGVLRRWRLAMCRW